MKNIMILSLIIILFGCTDPTSTTTYTVTFLDGTSVLREEVVNEGSNLSEFSSYVPVKDGYEFKGWFSDVGLSTLFNFNVSITEDVTIYSKWEEVIDNPETYTVKFMDGETQIRSEVVSHDSNINHFSTYVPVKEGYDFLGWFTDSELTIEFEFNVSITEDIVIYSKWELKIGSPVKFTVKFMDGVIELNSIQLEEGSLITRPTDDPTKEGYDFVDWYSNSGLTTLFVFDNQITEDMVVYGKFVVNAYGTWYFDILQTGAQGGTITYARIREAALQQGINLSDISDETLDLWFDGDGEDWYEGIENYDGGGGYCIDIYVSSQANPTQWDGPGNRIPHWWEEEATDSSIHGYATQYRQHWCSGASSIDLKSGAAYTLMLRIVKLVTLR